MYIINGIAYAGEFRNEIKVNAVKAIGDLMLLVTFSTGEKRLFDVTQLLDMPAFKVLKDDSIFNTVSVDHGVVVWSGGDIDLAPETMYVNSFEHPV